MISLGRSIKDIMEEEMAIERATLSSMISLGRSIKDIMEEERAVEKTSSCLRGIARTSVLRLKY